MSLSDVRTYFRTRLNYLGYKEWDDGFNYENIPENIIDKAYHIENFEGDKVSLNQTDLEIDMKVVTRIYFKGFRTIKEALDRADEKLETIFVEVLKPTNRLTGSSGLRDIQLDSFVKLPIAASNDNTILAEITWTAQINICTN